MSSKRVGYGHPPVERRFAKGKSGNPLGRPRKVVREEDNTEIEILKRLDAQLIEYQGKMITRREAELMVLQAKALKGDIRAIELLDRKRSSVGIDKAPVRGGVLVVPMAPSPEEWAKRAAGSQAKYREAGYGHDPDDFSAAERNH